MIASILVISLLLNLVLLAFIWDQARIRAKDELYRWRPYPVHPEHLRHTRRERRPRKR